MATASSMLLFGQEHPAHFPGACVQAVRFRGTDKATILDHVDLKMPLISAIDQAVAIVEKHALRGANIGRLCREDRWNLPFAPVREAIVNAVAHADYFQRGTPIRLAVFDDRLETENPGL